MIEMPSFRTEVNFPDLSAALIEDTAIKCKCSSGFLAGPLRS
jgi:hypothetical protein